MAHNHLFILDGIRKASMIKLQFDWVLIPSAATKDKQRHRTVYLSSQTHHVYRSPLRSSTTAAAHPSRTVSNMFSHPLSLRATALASKRIGGSVVGKRMPGEEDVGVPFNEGCFWVSEVTMGRR
jgi:hypothetical protein